MFKIKSVRPSECAVHRRWLRRRDGARPLSSVSRTFPSNPHAVSFLLSIFDFPLPPRNSFTASQKGKQNGVWSSEITVRANIFANHSQKCHHSLEQCLCLQYHTLFMITSNTMLFKSREVETSFFARIRKMEDQDFFLLFLRFFCGWYNGFGRKF